MFPTPMGYISIPDAVDRVLRALHGEPEEIPWIDGDEPNKTTLDEAVLARGRRQSTGAQEWLLAELVAGRLVAQARDHEIPAEYWTCNGAHTTAHTGCLQPPEVSASDYAEIAYKPCFIERSAFEKRLAKVPGVRSPRGRKPGDGAIDDSASHNEMEHLINTGEAKSPWDAAGKVAPHAKGGGDDASRKRRLWRKWQKLHG